MLKNSQKLLIKITKNVIIYRKNLIFNKISEILNVRIVYFKKVAFKRLKS